MTVIVGRCDCESGDFPCAALVIVDGQIVVSGGLQREVVDAFVADVTGQAQVFWPRAAIARHVDATAAAVLAVPCPPPKPRLTREEMALLPAALASGSLADLFAGRSEAAPERRAG